MCNNCFNLDLNYCSLHTKPLTNEAALAKKLESFTIYIHSPVICLQIIWHLRYGAYGMYVAYKLAFPN